MRTLGTTHNVMHQTMTELALHAREEREDPHVPDFDDRISGGDWTRYREALEEAGEEGEWMDFVHITEVMHDRVHHPMYNAVVYHHATMSPDAELAEYVDEPEDAPRAELIPDRDAIGAAFIPLEAFRTVMWEEEPERLYWRAAMQNAVVFGHLMDQLTQQRVQYAFDEKTGACRPDFVGRFSEAQWEGYVAQVAGCDRARWRDLVETHDLARLRVHQVMSRMADMHPGS